MVDPEIETLEVLTESDLHRFDQVFLRPGSVS
jgi:hypothetical protein